MLYTSVRDITSGWNLAPWENFSTAGPPLKNFTGPSMKEHSRVF